MIERMQYRGCLRTDACGADGTAPGEHAAPRLSWEQALVQARENVRREIRDGRILTASLYRCGKLCFLYCEALEPGIVPEDFLAPLAPFLETWPEENGRTPWAYMYHIYHHSVPEDIASWEAERAGRKTRIGRIAFVYPEKLFSYTYWHKAIVDEGLLKGDKYQCISLHENILFSYFEEPKTMVNIRKDDVHESRVIEEWIRQDPESHFDRKKAGGENFIIIEPLLSVGRGDL